MMLLSLSLAFRLLRRFLSSCKLCFSLDALLATLVPGVCVFSFYAEPSASVSKETSLHFP